MNKITKIVSTEIKSIDENAHTITALVSSKKQDRYNDVVLPEAFRKRLKIYKDHPVLLSSHSYGDLRKQIGEAVSINIVDEGLEAKFKYYVGLGNPEADWAWVLAMKGIAAFSIGFMSYEYEDIKDKENGYTIGRKFTDIELVEISQVLTPASREALQDSFEFNKAEGELLEMAIKSFEKGDIKPLEQKAISEEDKGNKEQPGDKKHYTEEVLDKGTKVQPMTKEELTSIVKSAVKQ